MKNEGFTADGKFRRDRRNPGALISVDAAGLAAYRAKKRSKAAINRVVSDYDTLRSDVESLKSSVEQILRILTK